MTLVAFGYQRPMRNLIGVSGRKLLAEIELPDPWRGHVDAGLVLIDDLSARIAETERELARAGAGAGAHHRYIPVLMTAPGIGSLPVIPNAEAAWTPSSHPLHVDGASTGRLLGGHC